MTNPCTDLVFVPGEIAIWQHLDGEDAPCNGQECIVMSHMQWAGELEDRTTLETGAGFGYDVKDAEGEWFAFFWELRKKKQPSAPSSAPTREEIEA